MDKRTASDIAYYDKLVKGLQAENARTVGTANQNRLGRTATATSEDLQRQRAAFNPSIGTPMIAAPNMAMAPQAQFRSGQEALVGALSQRALGQGGASPAEIQQQQNFARAIAAQNSLARGASGAGGALARRSAMQQGAAIQAQAVQQGALLRAQEQQAAQAALGGVLTGARGQDINLATTDASLGLDADKAAAQLNLNADIARSGMELDADKFYTGAGLQTDQFYAGLGAQLDTTQQQAANAQYMQTQGFQNQMALNKQMQDYQDDVWWRETGKDVVGGGLQAVGTGLGLMSDENIKEDIKDGTKQTRDFLDALSAKMFRYKGDTKEHLGIIAQDLEKTEAGKHAVIETPQGKAIDVPQALGRVLASMADINKRLKAVGA